LARGCITHHSPALPLASVLLVRQAHGLRMVALVGAHLMFLSASARVLPLALEQYVPHLARLLPSSR
jgi:hypothetical protein